ncbi:MAG: hypothetical protein IJ192_05720 [Clostridia bacterium]|nr:hypothetical protein [Clostridia bacterium]
MNILIDNLDNICSQLDYHFKNEYPNSELNKAFNYWVVLENFETEIQSLANETIDTILYSKYYWSCRFVEMYELMVGFDAGMEQQRDNIVEEISERLMDTVDWELLQAISENNL